MIQEFQMVRQAGEAQEHIVKGSRLRLNEEDPFTICSQASPACLPIQVSVVIINWRTRVSLEQLEAQDN